MHVCRLPHVMHGRDNHARTFSRPHASGCFATRLGCCVSRCLEHVTVTHSACQSTLTNVCFYAITCVWQFLPVAVARWRPPPAALPQTGYVHAHTLPGLPGRFGGFSPLERQRGLKLLTHAVVSRGEPRPSFRV